MDDEYVAKYTAFFEYMGLPVSKGLTAAKLEAIQEEGFDSWYVENFKPTDKQHTAFNYRASEWWQGDRFITHPDLFKKEINSYLTRDLPEVLATYVRNQFRGNTQQITTVKIEEVYQTMLKEDPTWWHSKLRNQIFSGRFKLAYPLSCDGKKPTNPTRGNTSPKRDGPNKKTVTINPFPIIIAIVVIFILYKFFL